MASTIKASDLVEYFRKALAESWGYIFGASGQEWTEAKQKQIVNKMASRYGSSWKNNAEAKDDDYYRSAVYGSKWVGHRVADCSGMFVGAFKEKGIAVSHSSHYQYTDYCKEKGTLKNGRRSNGEEIVPGDAVFVWKDEKKRYTHVGLYVGSGIVIEAKGTEYGVVTSNVTDSKWNRWGKFKAVDYSDGEPEKPADPEPEQPEMRPTLKKGSKGTWVKNLQNLLLKLGYKLPRYGADGDFGAETEKAVRDFQQDMVLWAFPNMKVDGVVGKDTWAALDYTEEWMAANPKPKTYRVTITGLAEGEALDLTNKYAAAIMEEEK